MRFFTKRGVQEDGRDKAKTKAIAQVTASDACQFSNTQGLSSERKLKNIISFFFGGWLFLVLTDSIERIEVNGVNQTKKIGRDVDVDIILAMI